MLRKGVGLGGGAGYFVYGRSDPEVGVRESNWGGDPGDR